MNNNNNRKKLNFKQNHFGYKKREEWFDGINAHVGYLPESVSIKDIDQGFTDMVKKELSPVVELIRGGETINDRMPAFFLTAERWAEISKTWEFTNEMKDISLPFITIVRNPDAQPGTGQGGFFNIPGRRNWTYMKVPNAQHGRSGVDLYKIPQPTAVDLTYEVKVFTNKLSDLNLSSELFRREYNAIQKYVTIKGHPMPTKNESVSDESILDLEERKMYIISYEILLQGYILNENDFEIVSSIDRIDSSAGISE